MDRETSDIADFTAYVEAMATALELSIPDEIKPGVVANMEHIWTIAQPVITFPLPNSLESAPIFEP
ncbi:MAG: DUF4089 domain-containing protein [Cyanobacteria bacterium J06638_6]